MKNLLIAAAIAAATASPLVMATSTATANLSNFKFTYTDLNLEDSTQAGGGITGSLGGSSLNASVSNPITGVTIGTFSDGAGLNDTGFELLTAFDGVSQASAEIFFSRFNGLDSNFFSFGAQGSTVGESGTFDAAAQNGSGFGFVLNPFSKVTITADSNISASISSTGIDDFIEKAYSQTFIITRNVEFGLGLQSFGELNASSFADLGFAQNLNQLMTLSIVLENFSDTFAGYSINIGAVAGGNSDGKVKDTPSAVPVPAALPLMASALGLFGFGAMRRKASKA